MTELVIPINGNASIKGAAINGVTDAAQIAYIAKVIHVNSEGFAHGLAENVPTQVLAVAGAYSHIPPVTDGRQDRSPRVLRSHWTSRRSTTSPRASAPTPSSARSTQTSRAQSSI